MRIAEKPKMTKTKQFCTDEDYLQSFARKHRIVDLILEYRGVKKLLSTYVEALPQLVNRSTGRIHTSFNQAVTATGRLSSTNPNLQNIPVRDDMGRRIRKAFIPSDDDHLLLSADYSQVELRLMAHLSGDESLIAAFEHGEDIHAATAAKLFNKTLDEVTSEERRRAKTANFGIIYGISAFGLSQRLEIPRKEAKEIIDGYFASYPGVKKYMDNVVEKAKEEGFVSTIFGRRRYLNDIASHNAIARGLAERNAVNAPIQGSAADIMKIAMINVHRRFAAEGIRSRVILQVHDELVVDMLRSEQERVTAIVTECMESAAQLKVRLIADAGGDYIYKKNTSNRSLPIDLEEAYMLTAQADMWLNAGSAASLGELKSQFPKFTNTRCVRNGAVYNCNKRLNVAGGNDYWESGVVQPDVVLHDLIAIMHPEVLDENDRELHYYQRLE